VPVQKGEVDPGDFAVVHEQDGELRVRTL